MIVFCDLFKVKRKPILKTFLLRFCTFYYSQISTNKKHLILYWVLISIFVSTSEPKRTSTAITVIVSVISIIKSIVSITVVVTIVTVTVVVTIVSITAVVTIVSVTVVVTIISVGTVRTPIRTTATGTEMSKK